MTRAGLTAREQQVFGVIRAELVAGRPAPTYTELGAAFGLGSRGNVHRLVSILVRKGYLVRGDIGNRALALAPDAETYTVHLPPEVDAQLAAHVASWGATPQCVIVAAVAEYLGRHA